jgi:hypothetical protein
LLPDLRFNGVHDGVPFIECLVECPAHVHCTASAKGSRLILAYKSEASCCSPEVCVQRQPIWHGLVWTWRGYLCAVSSNIEVPNWPPLCVNPKDMFYHLWSGAGTGNGGASVSSSIIIGGPHTVRPMGICPSVITNPPPIKSLNRLFRPVA